MIGNPGLHRRQADVFSVDVRTMEHDLLVVGLGNPGSKYAHHRHNVGFMVVDALAEHYSGTFKKQFKGEFAQVESHGHKLYLLKPQTFMNLSGESVQPAAKYFKVTPAQVLVIHDELDLPFGTLRFKRGGGVAGHNGLRSTVKHLGTQDFMRLRFGIGRPSHGNVNGHVLSDFRKDEKQELTRLLEDSCEWIQTLTEIGLQGSMNKLHSLC